MLRGRGIRFLFLPRTAVSLLFHEADQCDGLEEEAGGVADGEGNGEEASLGGMGEEVECEDEEMEEEDADDGAEEDLDEGLRGAVHALGDYEVLNGCDDAEIECQKRHSDKEAGRPEPHDAEGDERQDECEGEEREEVFFHYSANFMVSLVVNFSQ